MIAIILPFYGHRNKQIEWHDTVQMLQITNCVYDDKVVFKCLLSTEILQKTTHKKNETPHTDKNKQFDEGKKCIDNLVKVSTFYDVTQLQIEMKNLFKWHIF